MSDKSNSTAEFKFLGSTASLENPIRILLDEAIKATKNAYAPYSGFHVGCVLLMEDGSMVHGSNQENAAYPSGLCAERVALFSAGAHQPKNKIKRMLVCAYRDNPENLLPASSCGGCRQVMFEFETRQNSPIEVIMMYKQDEWVLSSTTAALLPLAFESSNVRKKRA
ncbi:MAG TPA: cytidine deaminase [Cyclobacteriaceae bacterium]|nr:cytidine deaminase [Cyclobacteriaceae bacterium]